MAEFLAVDWGTTNRRIYHFSNGKMIATERDDRGVKIVTDYERELSGIRETFGDLPVLLSGMVGSTLGWREVPYVGVPADIASLADGLTWIDARTAITPGVAVYGENRCDMMRGEEVQFLGAVVGGLTPADALLVQPGTHCKWACMRDGRIVQFATAMTGEIFALLRTESVLSPMLGGDVRLGDAFLEGVEEGRRSDLGASLFSVRARGVLQHRDVEELTSYASGILIGADVAARLAEFDEGPAHILAAPDLGGLYAAAIRALGREAKVIDSHAAFVAGIGWIGGRIW